MKAKNSSKIKSGYNNLKPVVAKESDGSIQITLTIPWSEISSNREKAVEELGKNIEVPGFRKGKAPLEKIKDRLPQDQLIEKTLSSILPLLVSKAITENKIKPAIYPKYELISANEGENWQVRATTCEVPEFELGDYRKYLKGVGTDTKIWTPDKAESKPTSTSKAEKEQKIIETLLNSIKLTIPKILINEEVNARLAKLLERIEKLGLTLENYLASINKTPDLIRNEYSKSSHDAIAIELILTKIAEKEAIKAEESEIDEAIKQSINAQNLNNINIDDLLKNPDQRNLVKTILFRRKALDFLISIT